jgi:hypothetical protein
VVGEKNSSHIYTWFVLKIKMSVVADVASNVKLMVVSMLKYEQMVKYYFVITFPSLNSMLR